MSNSFSSNLENDVDEEHDDSHPELLGRKTIGSIDDEKNKSRFQKYMNKNKTNLHQRYFLLHEHSPSGAQLYTFAAEMYREDGMLVESEKARRLRRKHINNYIEKYNEEVMKYAEPLVLLDQNSQRNASSLSKYLPTKVLGHKPVGFVKKSLLEAILRKVRDRVKSELFFLSFDMPDIPVIGTDIEGEIVQMNHRADRILQVSKVPDDVDLMKYLKSDPFNLEELEEEGEEEYSIIPLHFLVTKQNPSSSTTDYILLYENQSDCCYAEYLLNNHVILSPNYYYPKRPPDGIVAQRYQIIRITEDHKGYVVIKWRDEVLKTLKKDMNVGNLTFDDITRVNNVWLIPNRQADECACVGKRTWMIFKFVDPFKRIFKKGNSSAVVVAGWLGKEADLFTYGMIFNRLFLEFEESAIDLKELDPRLCGSIRFKRPVGDSFVSMHVDGGDNKKNRTAQGIKAKGGEYLSRDNGYTTRHPPRKYGKTIYPEDERYPTNKEIFLDHVRSLEVMDEELDVAIEKLRKEKGKKMEKSFKIKIKNAKSSRKKDSLRSELEDKLEKIEAVDLQKKESEIIIHRNEDMFGGTFDCPSQNVGCSISDLCCSKLYFNVIFYKNVKKAPSMKRYLSYKEGGFPISRINHRTIVRFEKNQKKKMYDLQKEFFYGEVDLQHLCLSKALFEYDSEGKTDLTNLPDENDFEDIDIPRDFVVELEAGEEYVLSYNKISPPEGGRSCPAPLHSGCFGIVCSIGHYLVATDKLSNFSLLSELRSSHLKKMNPKCFEAKVSLNSIMLQYDQYPSIFRNVFRCAHSLVSVSLQFYANIYDLCRMRISGFLYFSIIRTIADLLIIGDREKLSEMAKERFIVNPFPVVSQEGDGGEDVEDEQSDERIFFVSDDFMGQRKHTLKKKKKEEKKKKKEKDNSWYEQTYIKDKKVNSLHIQNMCHNWVRFIETFLPYFHEYRGASVCLGLLGFTEETIEGIFPFLKSSCIQSTNGMTDLFLTPHIAWCCRRDYATSPSSSKSRGFSFPIPCIEKWCVCLWDFFTPMKELCWDFVKGLKDNGYGEIVKLDRNGNSMMFDLSGPFLQPDAVKVILVCVCCNNIGSEMSEYVKLGDVETGELGRILQKFGADVPILRKRGKDESKLEDEEEESESNEMKRKRRKR